MLLLSPARHWERNVLELAVNSEMKDFLAHRHCQNIIDQNLHGDVNDNLIESTSHRNPLALEPSCAMLPYRFQREPRGSDEWIILLHACCPCILKLRRAPGSRSDRRNAE